MRTARPVVQRAVGPLDRLLEASRGEGERKTEANCLWRTTLPMGSEPGKIDSTFRWTGDTGNSTGIQGNNTFRVTSIDKNPASRIVWEWQLP
jgi:hypothetical protein